MMRLTVFVLAACSLTALAGCSGSSVGDAAAPVAISTSAASPSWTAASTVAPTVTSSLDSAGQGDQRGSHQRPASVLLQTGSPGDSGGLLRVQGTLGVSDRGCVTLTDRIERIVVVSADGRLSADGLRVLIPGEETLEVGDFIQAEGRTKRDLSNLPDDLVPRASRRCEPGPYVFLDPT